MNAQWPWDTISSDLTLYPRRWLKCPKTWGQLEIRAPIVLPPGRYQYGPLETLWDQRFHSQRARRILIPDQLLRSLRENRHTQKTRQRLSQLGLEWYMLEHDLKNEIVVSLLRTTLELPMRSMPQFYTIVENRTSSFEGDGKHYEEYETSIVSKAVYYPAGTYRVERVPKLAFDAHHERFSVHEVRGILIPPHTQISDSIQQLKLRLEQRQLRIIMLAEQFKKTYARERHLLAPPQ